MAFLEDALGGWGGGLLIGLGAALIVPSVLPTGSTLRPVVKTLVRGALVLADGVKEVVAEAAEQVNDLVAEVRAESGTKRSGSEAEHHRSASGHH